MEDVRRTMENKIGEAPASSTVKIKSKNGFEYLFTLRDMTGTTLLDKMEKLEIDLLARGYSALSQSFSKFTEKPKLPEKPCPIHPTMLKERDGKNGKFWSHSMGTYPNLTWCNGQVKDEIPERQVGSYGTEGIDIAKDY